VRNFLRALGAVFSGFIGIRKHRSAESDEKQIYPVLLVAAGVCAVLLLVVLLLIVVHNIV
jgi:Tfp pilus assembly protein PilN